MHPHFEHAAQILQFMTRTGADVPFEANLCQLLDQTAHMLESAMNENRSLSDYGAAIWILSDLEKRKLLTCETSKRKRVLAVLGTGVGNMRSALQRHK